MQLEVPQLLDRLFVKSLIWKVALAGGRRTLMWKVSGVWFRRTCIQMEMGSRVRGMGARMLKCNGIYHQLPSLKTDTNS